MKPYLPRVAAVHDLSSVGRCSLTVIMPVLSTMGIQVCPLPTAVLSSHLGGFTGLELCDFTDRMPGFFHHWQKEDISFEGIYSGFLASERQIDIVHDFIDCFAQSLPMVVIDPVMGDEGKLYSIFTPHMQEKMKTLLRRANLITPNYTEACFLLGEPYREQIQNMEQMKEWLVRLAAFGPDAVVMTGIPFKQEKLVNLGYERQTQSFWEVASDYIPARYPGTGDIFASVLLGALLHRCSLPKAMRLAADFVALAVKTTYQARTPRREGVLLELVLPWLNQNFKA